MFRSELTRPSAFRLGGAACIAAALPKGVCPVGFGNCADPPQSVNIVAAAQMLRA